MGTILTAIFDILWLGSILVLSVSSVWLIFSIVRILRRLETHLIAATEDSTHAMTQLAQAVFTSHVERPLERPQKPTTPQKPTPKPTPTSRGPSKRRSPGQP